MRRSSRPRPAPRAQAPKLPPSGPGRRPGSRPARSPAPSRPRAPRPSGAGPSEGGWQAHRPPASVVPTGRQHVADPDDSPPAPSGYSRSIYRNVPVAYDGSELARIALAPAAGIARGAGASRALVEAVAGKVPSPAPGGPPLAKPEKRAMAREDLNRAIERLDPELEAAGWVIGGSPAKGILTVADDIGADLIVTGSRARGAVTRTVLGSVSTEILHGAHCDVLVVQDSAD